MSEEAVVTRDSTATDARQTYILFTVAGTSYAVPSRHVLHIEMVEHVTPVPNAPRFVEGVVFSRGQVVPVVNLRTRFGFDRAELDLRTRELENIEPVHVRHVQIQHHHLHRLHGEDLDGLKAGSGFYKRDVGQTSERGTDHPPHRVRVVNDQNGMHPTHDLLRRGRGYHSRRVASDWNRSAACAFAG